jgi:pimeloyl-ACP methyl ester carboxylesterase
MLDNLQIKTCSLVAISGGGPTGLAFAASFPERVTRLVLAEAISKPEDRPNEQVIKTKPLSMDRCMQ